MSRYYYQSADVETRLVRKVVFFSIAGTLCIFLFLPFSELLTSSMKKLVFRKVDVAVVPIPLPEKKLPLQKLKERKTVKPRLSKDMRKLNPLRIDAALSLNNEWVGDFALNFDINADFSNEDFIFELEAVDTHPQPIVRMPPLYPVQARMKGIEGYVVLVFVVNEQGKVSDVVVESSTPGDIFVDSAVSAVKKWRFKPAAKYGKPVAVRVNLPLKFTLR